MDLIILLALSGIIILFLIWILEIPALLVRIYTYHDSWDQISGSWKIFLFSPIYIVVIGGTFMFLGILMAIFVVGLILLIPISIVLLPIGFLIYLWYQLGEMMLEISQGMEKGLSKRME
jgi:hypothetical protein